MEEIKLWLSDKKRTHADGITLFEKYAPADFKQKYLVFFKKGSGPTEHAMLINKLVFIVQNNIAVKPKINVVTPIPEKAPVTQTSPQINDGAVVMGLKKIDAEFLPKKLKEKYARIQEITPLMASLHTQLGNKDLNEDKAKELAEELCKLDDERSELWDAIDEWAEGKIDETEEGVSRIELSEDLLVQGLQIANRITRIKQNIARGKKTITEAKSEKVKENAQATIARYEQELDQLQALIPSK